MRYLTLFILFASMLYSLNIEMPQKSVTNGKTALLEFEKQDGILYEKLILDKKEYKVYEHPRDVKKFYALIPINYYEKPSSKTIKLFYKQDAKEMSKTIPLEVKEGIYKKETLKVQQSKVTLSQKDKRRAEKEYAEAMKVYNTLTPKSYISSKFIAPMQSKITSEFGKARVYNDTLKGYHSGTDYRASVGTPIVASNDGVVALVKDRFYSGGSVVIDHGQGIYTCYFHMSKFDVKKGQAVKKGELIGLSGKSGRVTGPHLHFSARVASEQVDPLQLIELLNKNLF
ncbi:MAG: M23 family metallopeptidase [Sulfurimonas sp.]|uniref:M23 family metallopeptidase n=1 Tax=Sulfurimonas sp. TaxID=2022749 RepID=UPI0025CF4D01|nr:M23 family metallopeptidase [Sulfurimonas sp.]MCK9491967.1 M23 family metallopeptidase [Sulfurimonas sp.]